MHGELGRDAPDRAQPVTEHGAKDSGHLAWGGVGVGSHEGRPGTVQPMRDRGPDFVIMGTPRSGTTLVQRLACELPGVQVPPETHFFTVYVPTLLARRGFPLAGDELREELRRYAGLTVTEPLDLDVEAVFDALDGRAAGIAAMYDAIVTQLGGSAAVLGEKTPGHLLWWPLLARMPGRRFVAVVRDPRAVVASAAQVPWGMDDPALIAQGWRYDQREVDAAARGLGDRLVVLRYEDVVRDPPSAKSRIADLLAVLVPEPALDADDVSVGPGPGSDGPALFNQREQAWKWRATEPTTSERVDAWRAELERDDVALIERVCGRAMLRFGYKLDTTPTARRRATAHLNPDRRARLLRHRAGRWRTARLVRSVTRAHPAAAPTAR